MAAPYTPALPRICHKIVVRERHAVRRRSLAAKDGIGPMVNVAPPARISAIVDRSAALQARSVRDVRRGKKVEWIICGAHVPEKAGKNISRARSRRNNTSLRGNSAAAGGDNHVRRLGRNGKIYIRQFCGRREKRAVIASEKLIKRIRSILRIDGVS